MQQFVCGIFVSHFLFQRSFLVRFDRILHLSDLLFHFFYLTIVGSIFLYQVGMLKLEIYERGLQLLHEYGIITVPQLGGDAWLRAAKLRLEIAHVFFSAWDRGLCLP